MNRVNSELLSQREVMQALSEREEAVKQLHDRLTSEQAGLVTHQHSIRSTLAQQSLNDQRHAQIETLSLQLAQVQQQQATQASQLQAREQELARLRLAPDARGSGGGASHSASTAGLLGLSVGHGMHELDQLHADFRKHTSTRGKITPLNALKTTLIRASRIIRAITLNQLIKRYSAQSKIPKKDPFYDKFGLNIIIIILNNFVFFSFLLFYPVNRW